MQFSTLNHILAMSTRLDSAEEALVDLGERAAAAVHVADSKGQQYLLGVSSAAIAEKLSLDCRRTGAKIIGFYRIPISILGILDDAGVSAEVEDDTVVSKIIANALSWSKPSDDDPKTAETSGLWRWDLCLDEKDRQVMVVRSSSPGAPVGPEFPILGRFSGPNALMNGLCSTLGMIRREEDEGIARAHEAAQAVRGLVEGLFDRLSRQEGEPDERRRGRRGGFFDFLRSDN